MKITKSTKTNRIFIESEYSQHTIRLCREHGGKWDATNRAWVFTDCEMVRDFLTAEYGWTGAEIRKEITISVDECEAFGCDLFYRGYLLASRAHRDWNVKLSEDVIGVAGPGFPGSGGSAKYPGVCPKDGTTLTISVYEGL